MKPILRVNVPKAADVFSDKLRDLIIQGVYPAGAMLPPEKELVEASGIGRSAVRDALRALEAEGLVITRAGRNGGSFVTLPHRGAIARHLEVFVRTHGVSLPDLLECRVTVEPTLARLAAAARTDAQLAEMEELHAQFERSVENVADYKRVNLEWHLAISRASSNEPLTALMEAISTPIRDAMDYQHVTTPALRALAVKAHGGILRAIRDGDGEAAERRMLRHVAEYRAIAQRTTTVSGTPEISNK